MSNNISKKLEEYDEFWVKRLHKLPLWQIKGETEIFWKTALLSQKDETADKLLQAFGLTIKDFPAFPPKDIDLFDLILKIGIEKVKREQREEIIKRLPKESKSKIDGFQNSFDRGFNKYLAEIKTIIKNI